MANHLIPKYQGNWKFDWEEPYLESMRTEPFVSDFADIEYMLKYLTNETGTRFKFEAYDSGHIYTLAYFMDIGLVQPPVFASIIAQLEQVRLAQADLPLLPQSGRSITLKQ